MCSCSPNPGSLVVDYRQPGSEMKGLCGRIHHSELWLVVNLVHWLQTFYRAVHCMYTPPEQNHREGHSMLL